MTEFDFSELFDKTASEAGEDTSAEKEPWKLLDRIPELIKKIVENGGFTEIKEGVYVGKDVKIAPSAYIDGPCVIGDGSEIRHCAYIRGNAIIGKKCVVGNSTELKNCILYDLVQVPHYNYVGDSILGKHAHLGAGAVISNLKSDGKNVVIKYKTDSGVREYETGRRKLGALIGDYAEIGCGCVLNPGTVIGKKSRVYPQCSVRGVVPSECIYKNEKEIVPIK